MMFRNKVVWITGASSGIGEALALEFAAQGASLILSSRREDRLKAVKEKCLGLNQHQAALVLAMDVTDLEAMPAIVERAHGFTGRIDMLINNAGISQRSGVVETDMAAYRKLFEVDVFGQIALTKAVLPIMLKQGSGHIAITSSVAGKLGVPFRTGYCSAKHAVMGFFDALRTEVTQHNIKVTTITPGFIRTSIAENAISGDGTPFGKTDESIVGGMEVDDCVRVIMRGLQKGKPEIAVGKGIEMTILWLKRLSPRLVFKIMAGQYDKIAASNKIGTKAEKP